MIKATSCLAILINWGESKLLKLGDSSNLHQIGKLRTSIKANIPKLKNEDHYIAATWSIENEKIAFVDRKEVVKKKIKF